MLLKSKAKEEFNVVPLTSAEFEGLIERCSMIYKGAPDWVNDDDHIKTINFAKSICSETARLTTLAAGIHVDGSARAEWLQSEIDKIYFKLRGWVEYGCAYGTIILKPNGESIDLVTPDRFIVTEQSNGDITGAIFIFSESSDDLKKNYTRLEWHRFTENGYTITNKCYVGTSKNNASKEIDISQTPWAGMMEEAVIENVEKPLFGVFRTPHANSVDIDSPMGLPVFYDALEELADLDVAYSRNAKEILDSARILLLDSDRMTPTGGKIEDISRSFQSARAAMGLPDMVKNVYGDGSNTFYQEINPSLNTDTRLSGINALLSQIGYKIGFSNGYFVFNESSGIQTATGVEAEQQRTIQFIKDVRDKLEDCLRGLVYAMSKMADLYNLAPLGEYEVVFDFGDITYNRDEDRSRWYGYVVSGKIPFWYYLVKFEGFTEEEAKVLEKEAKPTMPTLFGQEE